MTTIRTDGVTWGQALAVQAAELYRLIYTVGSLCLVLSVPVKIYQNRRRLIMDLKLTLIALALLLPTYSDAFTAYNCEDPGATYKVLDGLEPEPCPDPVSDYFPDQSVAVQVLQTDGEHVVEATSCRILLDKETVRCGFNSLTYGSMFPAYKKQLPITAEECLKIYEKGEVEVEGQKISVKINEPTHFRFVSHGAVYDDGSCKGATFQSEGRHFEKSYQITVVEVHVRKLRGTVKPGSSRVFFTNGIHADFEQGQVRDAYEGTLTWPTEQPSCKEKVSEIYKGRAELHRFKSPAAKIAEQRNEVMTEKTLNKDLRESIVIVNDDHTNQRAGFVLRQPIHICSRRCWASQAPNLIICLTDVGEGTEEIEGAKFKAAFDPANSQLTSMISYLHLTTNLRISGHFSDLQANLCDLDRQHLRTKLHSLQGADNKYALLDHYGPGHAVYAAGAAIYVTKCKPVEVTKAEFPNCTAEIPVDVNGTRLFADAHSLILSPYPTVLPCNGIMPVRWRLGREWYCASPHINRCDEPEKMKLSFSSNSSFGDFARGLGGGLFTDEQTAAANLFQQVIYSRGATLTQVTYQALEEAKRTSGQYLRFQSGITMDEVLHNVGIHFFPVFMLLGAAASYLVNAMMAIAVIKLLIGGIYRIALGLSKRGPGWWMIPAFCSTAFAILDFPWKMVRSSIKDIEAGQVSAEAERLFPGDPHGQKGFIAEWLAAKEAKEAEETGVAAEASKTDGPTPRRRRHSGRYASAPPYYQPSPNRRRRKRSKGSGSDSDSDTGKKGGPKGFQPLEMTPSHTWNTRESAADAGPQPAARPGPSRPLPPQPTAPEQAAAPRGIPDFNALAAALTRHE